MDPEIEDRDNKIIESSDIHTEDLLIHENHYIKHIEISVLTIYPITIILGSLSTLTKGIHTSYFSRSSNLFNVIFAKQGWFWTSLVFIYHLTRIEYKDILKACFRWLLATLWWFFITQWFFGLSIMDRSSVWTGGKCKFDDAKLNNTREHNIYSSVKCKLAGGKWIEGYDFSGHAFLLTHASLFLWSELLLTLSSGPKFVKQFQTIAIIALLFLWWFMLLMTACYFHVLMEKVIGLVIGYFTWASIYFFGPKNPIGKKILGL
ncbi:hypothetical protein PCANB_001108 [Pneumocystis canis]|nr:hypothetical protein PCANB_001108 [Pneumocystis canis]